MNRGGVNRLSVWSHMDGTPAFERGASPLARKRGWLRVGSSGRPASIDRTPHLSPLPLFEGRGEAKRNAVTTERS